MNQQFVLKLQVYGNDEPRHVFCDGKWSIYRRKNHQKLDKVTARAASKATTTCLYSRCFEKIYNKTPDTHQDEVHDKNYTDDGLEESDVLRNLDEMVEILLLMLTIFCTRSDGSLEKKVGAAFSY